MLAAPLGDALGVRLEVAGRLMATATIAVHVAWWVRWYVAGVALVSKLTGAEPDMGKVMRWIERGVRVRAR